jgi:hypothetical protein
MAAHLPLLHRFVNALDTRDDHFSMTSNRFDILQAIIEIVGDTVEQRANHEEEDRQDGNQRYNDNYCQNDKSHLSSFFLSRVISGTLTAVSA